MANTKLQSFKGKLFKKKESIQDSVDFPRDRLSARRGAVEIKGRGSDYTIKGGRWKLWIETLNHEEMSDLKEVFANFDKDGSGEISTTDLGFCMKYLGENPTELEIQEMTMRIKKNTKGTIEFPEFATEMAKRRRNSNEIIRQAFEEFDESGDGLISLDEVKKFVSQSVTDEEITENDFDELIKDFDVDGDGYLDYAEFMEITQMSL